MNRKILFDKKKFKFCYIKMFVLDIDIGLPKGMKSLTGRLVSNIWGKICTNKNFVISIKKL
jgi:hypothetical protein